jgi:hypothetical protein
LGISRQALNKRLKKADQQSSHAWNSDTYKNTWIFKKLTLFRINYEKSILHLVEEN